MEITIKASFLHDPIESFEEVGKDLGTIIEQPFHVSSSFEGKVVEPKKRLIALEREYVHLKGYVRMYYVRDFGIVGDDKRAIEIGSRKYAEDELERLSNKKTQ